MPNPPVSRFATPAPDPRLQQLVRGAMLLGLALVLLLPDARTFSPLLGWVPLWLLGMPAAAWWSLNRFRLPVPQSVPVPARRPGRRRPGAQARRREGSAPPRRLPRAA